MTEEDSKSTGLSETELDVLLSGPAVLVNKVYATAMPSGMRIAFCENRGDDTTNQFRSAVVLSYSDVQGFIELLQRLMKRVDFKFVSTPVENWPTWPIEN